MYTNLDEDLSINDIAFLNESDNVKNQYDIKYNRKEKSLGA